MTSKYSTALAGLIVALAAAWCLIEMALYERHEIEVQYSVDGVKCGSWTLEVAGGTTYLLDRNGKIKLGRDMVDQTRLCRLLNPLNGNSFSFVEPRFRIGFTKIDFREKGSDVEFERNGLFLKHRDQSQWRNVNAGAIEQK